MTLRSRLIVGLLTIAVILVIPLLIAVQAMDRLHHAVSLFVPLGFDARVFGSHGSLLLRNRASTHQGGIFLVGIGDGVAKIAFASQSGFGVASLARAALEGPLALHLHAPLLGVAIGGEGAHQIHQVIDFVFGQAEALDTTIKEGVRLPAFVVVIDHIPQRG